MSDLHLNSNELDECWDEYLLTLPTVFDECMSAEQQILWLLVHKQDLLVEGDNITLTPNEDGTVTISSEASGATYTIETATPDEGYTSAYILKNVDTGEQAGAKIQVPTVAGPQGPAGPQGETGAQGPQGVPGQDGADGNGISSITSQHISGQSTDIRSKIPSASNPMDPSPWGEGRHSMADGTYYVVVGAKNSQAIYTSQLTVDGIIYGYTVDLMPVDNNETYVEFTLNGFAPIVKLISGVYPFEDFTTESLVLRDSQNNEVGRYYLRDYVDQSRVMEFTNVPAGTYTIHLETTENHSNLAVQIWGLSVPAANGFTQVTVNYTNSGSATFNVPDGATGAQGEPGEPGQGVPAGGYAGYVLTKTDNTDYNTQWKYFNALVGATRGRIYRGWGSSNIWQWNPVVGLCEYKMSNTLWATPGDATYPFSSVTVLNSSDDLAKAKALAYIYRKYTSGTDYDQSLSEQLVNMRLLLVATVVVGTGNWQTRISTPGNYGSVLRYPPNGEAGTGGNIMGDSYYNSYYSGNGRSYNVPAMLIFRDTTTNEIHYRRGMLSISINVSRYFHFAISSDNPYALPEGTYELTVTAGGY